MKNDDEIKNHLRKLAHEAGFDAVGFCRAETSDQAKADLHAFNAGGYAGDMAWMWETEERRADPKTLWPAARSIIVLGLNYTAAYDPLEALENKDRPLISTYAQNRDYHDVVKKRLKAMARAMVAKYDCEVKVFVDTAPVMEKPIAAQTSLGWQGRHTCLVSRSYGSWLFLGEIYTTLEIAPDVAHPNLCGTCQSCLDICPTNAFLESGKIDSRRCISYLSIEYDGVIAPELARKMGNRIYGCDDCLAVCPWNKFAPVHDIAAFQTREAFKTADLKDWLGLDDEAFRTLFSGSPVKRIKRHRFMRNLLIATRNAERRDLVEQVRKLTVDEHDVIAQTARWVLEEWNVF